MENPKPTLDDIKKVMRNIKSGFVEARNITKEDSHKYSKDILDKAWKLTEELINDVAKSFFNIPPPKKYAPFTKAHSLLHSLLVELVKTHQNAFRLAEEGYYRSAFGELRDILELIMKIKLFYENPEEFNKWYSDPNRLYTTKEMRSLDLFKKIGYQ